MQKTTYNVIAVCEQTGERMRRRNSFHTETTDIDRVEADVEDSGGEGEDSHIKIGEEEDGSNDSQSD